MLRTLPLIPCLALLFSTTGCKDDADGSPDERRYELVWSDEFEGASGEAVDSTKWTYDLGRGTAGWGNNELQSYTKNSRNVALDGNGNLVINALKEGNGEYTSARIKTEGLFAHQHGRVEARIKTPSGQGVWPAFWMLGQNINEVGWPQCGEIDIMEQKGQYPFITYGSLHGPGYSAGNAITGSYRLPTENFDDDFYIYSIEWGEDFIDFYLNETLYASSSPSTVTGEWVYNKPFFIILNVAVGGSFVGDPNENTPFPGSMYVDYVRVYKEI